MAGISGAGTHSTVSHPLVLGMAVLSSSRNGFTSLATLFIFQLPAMMVFLYFLFILSPDYIILFPCPAKHATPGSRRSGFD